MTQEETTVTIELIPLRAKVVLCFDPDRGLCTSKWYDLDGSESRGSVTYLSQEKWSEFLLNLDAGIAPRVF